MFFQESVVAQVNGLIALVIAVSNATAKPRMLIRRRQHAVLGQRCGRVYAYQRQDRVEQRYSVNVSDLASRDMR
jgi:hypothetical protein